MAADVTNRVWSPEESPERQEVANARVAPGLRVLRQGSAAIGQRRDDLLVRVHVLSRLRRQPARWTLPQLRRQLHAPPGPAGVEAREKSTIDAARLQATGLRPRGTIDLGH